MSADTIIGRFVIHGDREEVYWNVLPDSIRERQFRGMGSQWITPQYRSVGEAQVAAEKLYWEYVLEMTEAV